MSTPCTDDARIIRQVIDGNVNAFEALVEKYQPHVFKLVRKHVPPQETEELAQEVFIRAYQGLAGYKGKTPFKGWLSGIAVRTCYDFWRKRYRSSEFAMSSLSKEQREWLERTLSDDSGQRLMEKASEEADRALLAYALDRLSPEDRMVMELVYLEGYAGKEAARILGWTVANVKVRAYRCRKKLKTIIQQLRKEGGP